MKTKSTAELLQDLTSIQKEPLLKHILTFITDHKRDLFYKNIENRTRHITVVMEDLFQPHNASAVMRSCDCFGIQDMHIIENKNKYAVNKEISLGSDQWVDVYNYKTKEDNTTDCLQQLKDKGYKIIATTPHKQDCLIQDLNIDSKTALIFGTEKDGLSQTAFAMADGFVKIPMYGFTESFNISVSAGITLYTIAEKLRASSIAWQLNDNEKMDILLKWACGVVKKSDLLITEFIKN